MEKELQNTTSISSSWSEPSNEFSRLACDRYLSILLKIEQSGKIILVFLILVFLGLSVSLIFRKDLEKIIFTDGSELTCVYDNSLNKVMSVDVLQGYQ